MKKNFTPNFEKKLTRYSAVAGAFVATSAANAQIVYYDIDPDIEFANSSGAIDINGDSNADFYFIDTNVVANNLWFAAVVPLGTQAVAADLGQYNYPFKLALNAPIDGTLTWLTGSLTGSLAFNVNSAFPYTGSHWQGDASDGYLGLRLDLLGNTHYGWLRASVAANTTSLILKDFAIEMTPNTPINAGQMPPVGVPELTNNIRVFNAFNVLNIDIINEITNANLTIVSTTGQIVESRNISNSEKIDLSHLAAGIYNVNIQAEEGVLIQKIMINK